ncbi:MAG: fimbrillin family protein [Bacteroidales bacterium]|nr:fimbrillin family protein [Bacteroidales bacterium]
MKKFFFFAAAALVALAACSKVDTVETPARKIGFNVGTYKAGTKADPSTKHALQGETNSFSSKAFLHADAGSGMTVQNMFGTTGETVSFTAGTPNVWEPSNEYFWPKAASSYINFVSWYSKNTKSQFSAANVTEISMDWGTNASPVTIDSTDNILFADLAYNLKENKKDFITTSGVAEGVPTLFHHALAKLQFNMKLKTSTVSTKTIWDVAIQEATLTIANNGYLALAIPVADTANKTKTTIPWKVGNDAATSDIVGWARPSTGSTNETLVETSSTAANTTKTLAKLSFETFAPKSLSDTATTAQVFLAERTVMPQTLGSNVQFSLKFKISLFHGNNGAKVGDAYSEEIVEIPVTNLTTLVPSITDWKMNTKYIYNVTIDPVGKKVLFDPAVVDWAEVASTDTQIYSQQ